MGASVTADENRRQKEAFERALVPLQPEISFASRCQGSVLSRHETARGSAGCASEEILER